MMMERPYSWGDWYNDYEDVCWELYWGMMRTVETMDLSIMDNLSFHDFFRMVRRTTSVPTAPPVPDEDDVQEESSSEEETKEEDEDDYESDYSDFY